MQDQSSLCQGSVPVSPYYASIWLKTLFKALVLNASGICIYGKAIRAFPKFKIYGLLCPLFDRTIFTKTGITLGGTMGKSALLFSKWHLHMESMGHFYNVRR